ncbi:hypothetical protein AN652_05640 [Xanthomonas arboricola pv. pruni]|nr:hypothetical protein DK27_00315 [Xanthomonas arboricola pv. pruni]KPN11501.1 hypothetical protein AN652_05640 [Xanthomonas arboricola pv. pruni]OEH49682.1 hypothetical protein XapnCFBP3894_17105 [Xanthomonas arboricola pv. pruni]
MPANRERASLPVFLWVFAALARVQSRAKTAWYMSATLVLGNTFAHVRSGLLQNAHPVIEI